MQNVDNKPMKITKDMIEYVAHLSRLELEPQEIDLYTEQIDRILSYMDTLNSLDTTHIEPTSHVVPLGTAFRDDIVQDSLPVGDATQNAPRRKGTFFEVPPIIEMEE